MNASLEDGARLVRRRNRANPRNVILACAVQRATADLLHAEAARLGVTMSELLAGILARYLDPIDIPVKK